MFVNVHVSRFVEDNTYWRGWKGVSDESISRCDNFLSVMAMYIGWVILRMRVRKRDRFRGVLNFKYMVSGMLRLVLSLLKKFTFELQICYIITIYIY